MTIYKSDVDFELSPASLPDVSVPLPQKDWGAELSWVGMNAIELPVRVATVINGRKSVIHVPARADFHVNLESREARGIHMSRLYKLISDLVVEHELEFPLLERLTREALITHSGLSSRAKVAVKFELPLQRRSLKSDLLGWRSYPVTFTVVQDGNRQRHFLKTQILYSSTCPASTALAEQLQARTESSHFVATPHAQRSQAQVTVEVRRNLPAAELIDLIEGAVGTPVQTLVKRQDEQEFAKLNAENTMFCEDAARRIDRALSGHPEILDFKGQVTHFESLHPHDAVAVFQKRPETSGRG